MSLIKFAENNIVVFDGAMGTSIQKVNIPDEVWQGKNGCNEFLNIASPDTIYNIHKAYFDAGANVAVTNTFGAIASVLAEYGLEEKVVEINQAAVNIARKAANGKENTFISLSMGPGTKLASLGHTTYESLYNQYLQQAECVDVDLYNIETAQDILQLKAAVNACIEANKRKNTNTPVLVSFTVENTYTLLTGSDISAVAAVMKGLPVFALGLNCAMGPDMLEPALAKLSQIWNGKIYISPNAGMPETIDGKTVYPMDANKFTEIMTKLMDKYPLHMVGGCCGTDYTHIQKLAAETKNKNLPNTNNFEYLGEASSLFNAVSLEQNPKPAIIGERANATGSKAFRDKLLADDYDGMAAICKNQENDGAHFIDLSTAYAGRNEIDDYKALVPMLNSSLTAPLVIDSTDPETIKASLELYSGKPIINSVNFEDGGKKLHRMFEIVKNHPACMVALTIDEEGMAQTAEKKFQIAKRLYDVWTKEYGFPAEDLIIDTLTFSIGSGDETLTNAAVETLNAIKMIKKELKGVKTTLGVSNISFGLSPASRLILNSVFLNEAVKAGLDTAIVHASKLTHISSLSQEDVDHCLNLIYAKENALPEFIEHFLNAKIETEEINEKLPPVEMLPQKIIKGDKTELENIISEILKTTKAEDIINNILFPAMQKVGDMFGEGKMLLPFVLKSAETMKAAVSILEPHLEKKEGASKGNVVIATVAGDVHDIGKNLVDIIMSNNGFNVHNLGIKVPVADMIKKAKEVSASAIGMSGLLVKSTLVMKENLEEIVKELPDIKIMLGGAALTNKFVNESCAPIMPDKVYYCKDAFDNIAAMDGSKQPAQNINTAKIEINNNFDNPVEENNKRADIEAIDYNNLPKPPFWNTKIINADINDAFKYLNKNFLFTNIWGYKRKEMSENEYNSLIKDTVEPELKNIFKDIIDKKAAEPKIIYGYFKCRSVENSIEVFAENETLLYTFSFPFSKSTPKYTLADFISKDEDHFDVLPVQLVTLGNKPAEYCNKLFKEGDYKNYYMAHGLFTELTEALAEYAHSLIRKDLKLSDKNENIQDVLAGRYRSKRFSFGYPLCPEIEYNDIILNMLQSERIGVQFSESHQMHPEYSTAAFIIHHPKIKY